MNQTAFFQKKPTSGRFGLGKQGFDRIQAFLRFLRPLRFAKIGQLLPFDLKSLPVGQDEPVELLDRRQDVTVVPAHQQAVQPEDQQGRFAIDEPKPWIHQEFQVQIDIVLDVEDFLELIRSLSSQLP